MPRTSSPKSKFRLVKRLPLCRFCLNEAAFESKSAAGTWVSLCHGDLRRRVTADTQFRELVPWGGLCQQEAA